MTFLTTLLKPLLEPLLDAFFTILLDDILEVVEHGFHL